jgi:uncharacterized protein (DUF433 family)
MNQRLIISDPEIMMGKPVIAGTRITVELILEKLASGETVEQVLEAHPRLSKKAILAALEFAAQSIRADVIYPGCESLQMNLFADESVDQPIVDKRNKGHFQKRVFTTSDKS